MKRNYIISLSVLSLFMLSVILFNPFAKKEEVAPSSGVTMNYADLTHVKATEKTDKEITNSVDDVKLVSKDVEKETIKSVESDMEEVEVQKVFNQVFEKITGDYMPTVALNLRDKSTTKSSVIKVLQKNQKLNAMQKTTDEEGIAWFKVTDGKVTGWVSSYYLVPYKKVEVQQVPKANAQTSGSKYKAMHIYYGGTAVPYKNGGQSNGQSIIDNSNYASTWGGATTFSGVDGLNTHLIGHRGGRGQFASMHNHNEFIVTDAEGRAFKYVKTNRYIVDEYGNRTDTGQSMYERITTTGGGERITLQSTYNHPLKWIVEATFVSQVQ